MQDLNNKVAVITGGAEGIGKAIAQRAAKEGMKLVLADIDGPRLDSTVAEFQAQNVDVLSLRTDVAKASEMDALAAATFARFGNVHLLVNNAGVALAKNAWDATIADWEWVLGVNLYGVIHGIRAFVPTMLAQGEVGHIVNVASVAGLISAPAFATYNVTKHAVVTLSEGMHHDLALRGSALKVSVLCPAWVKTRIAESERNRDSADRSDPKKMDPVTMQVASAVLSAVEHGIDPSKVAEAVFQAIAAERFYILTHPDTKAAVKVRMEDILQGRNPTLLSMDAGAGQ